MLTEQEKYFVEYWEKNRLRKKRLAVQLSVGLPLGVGFVILIFVNFFSGWYKRAGMVLNTTASSLIWVLLLAALLIVIFISIFSSRHKWEMNEQRYRELLSKKHSDG